MPNSIATWYRSAYPKEAEGLTDDQITLKYAKDAEAIKARDGVDLFQRYPDFAADVERIRKEEIRRSLTVGDYAKGVVGGIAGGAVRTIGSIPQAGAAVLNRVTGGDIDLRGFTEGATEWAADAVSPDLDPEKQEVLSGGFLTGTVPQGLGSALGFMASGGAGGLIGRGIGMGVRAAQTASIATAGAASSFTEQYNAAKASGASEDDAFRAGLLGAGVGATEVVPLARMLNRLDGVIPGAKTGLVQAALTAGKESVEESIQEAFQSGAGDVIASAIVGYDKERELFADLAQDAAAGGVTGLLFSLLTQGVGNIRAGRSAAGATREQPVREAQQVEAPVSEEEPSAPQAEPEPEPLIGSSPQEIALANYAIDHAGLRDLAKRKVNGDPVDAEEAALDPDAARIFRSYFLEEAQAKAAAVQSPPDDEQTATTDAKQDPAEESKPAPADAGIPAGPPPQSVDATGTDGLAEGVAEPEAAQPEPQPEPTPEPEAQQEAPKPQAAPPSSQSAIALNRAVSELDEAGKASFREAVISAVGNFNAAHNAEENRVYLEADAKAAELQERRLVEASRKIGAELDALAEKEPKTEEEAGAIKDKVQELERRAALLSASAGRIAELRQKTELALREFQAATATAEAVITPAAVDHEYGLDFLADPDEDDGRTKILKRPGYYERGDTTEAGVLMHELVAQYEGSSDEAGRNAAADQLGSLLTAQAQVKGVSTSLTRRITAWEDPSGRVVLAGSYNRTAQKNKGANKRYVFSVAPTAKPGQAGSNVGIRDLMDAGFRPIASMLMRSPRKQIARMIPARSLYDAEFGVLKQERQEAFRYEPTAEARKIADSADNEQWEIRDTSVIIPSEKEEAEIESAVDGWMADNIALLKEIGEWGYANPDAEFEVVLTTFQEKLWESVDALGLSDEVRAEVMIGISNRMLRFLDGYATKRKRHESKVSQGIDALSEGSAGQTSDVGSSSSGVGDGGSPQAGTGGEGETPGEDSAAAAIDQSEINDILEEIASAEEAGKISPAEAEALRQEVNDADSVDDIDDIAKRLFAMASPSRDRMRDPDGYPEVDFRTGRVYYPALLPDSVASVTSNINRLKKMPKGSPSRSGLLGTTSVEWVRSNYGSVDDALAQIASEEEGNRNYRELADRIRRNIALTGVTLNFSTTDPSDPRRVARFNADTAEITVYLGTHRDLSDLHTTILHEVLHAYTTRMRLRSSLPGGVSSQEREVISELERIIATARAAGLSWQQSESPDAAVVFDEFVAAVMTDPAFAAELAKIEAPASLGDPAAKTLWDAVKRAFARMVQFILGQPTTESPASATKAASSLDEATKLISELIDGYNEITAQADKLVQPLVDADRAAILKNGRFYMGKRISEVYAFVAPEPAPFPPAQDHVAAMRSLVNQANDPKKPRGQGVEVNLRNPDYVAAKKAGVDPVAGRLIHAITASDRKTPSLSKVASAPLVTSTIRNPDFLSKGMVGAGSSPGWFFVKLYDIGGVPTWHAVEVQQDGGFVTQYSFPTTDPNERVWRSTIEKVGPRLPQVAEAGPGHNGLSAPGVPSAGAVGLGGVGRAPSLIRRTLEISLKHAASTGAPEAQGLTYPTTDHVYAAEAAGLISDEAALEAVGWLESEATIVAGAPQGGEKIRYRIVEGLFGTDQDITVDPSDYAMDPTREAAKMMATTNFVDEALRDALRAWERNGGNRLATGATALNYEQFVRSVVLSVFRGVSASPNDIRAAINNALTSQGAPPISTTTKFGDLEAKSEAPKAARDALVALQKLIGKLADRHREIQDAFGKQNILGQIAKLSSELHEVTQKYTDLTIISREFVKELRRTYNESEDVGAGSILKSLGVAAGRKKSIEAAVNTIQNDVRSHVDALQALADLGIDYGGLRNGSVTPAAIQAAVAASIDPALKRYAADPALLAVALQFARRRPLVMDLLAARKGGPERTTLDRIIALAVSNRDDAFDLAQRELSRLKTLGSIGTRVLARLQAIKKRHRTLLDTANRYAEFESFFIAARPVLQANVQRLERLLQIEGHSVEERIWAPVDGAVYFVPEYESAPESEVFSMSPDSPSRKTIQLGEGRYNFADVEADRQKMMAWMKRNDRLAGTPNYRLMQRMVDGLARIHADAADRQLQRGPGGWVLKVFGDIASRMEAIGLQSTRQSAQQVRRYQSLYETHLKTPDQKEFYTFDRMFREAMLATKIENPEVFKERFYDKAFGYLETRQDLIGPSLSEEEQLGRAMAAVQAYLSRAENGDPILRANPDAWRPIERMLRQAVKCSALIQKVRRSMNLMIRDELSDGRVIFREAIGSPAFTMSRLVANGIRSVVREMATESSWQSTFRDAEGNTTRKLTKSVIEGLYANPDMREELSKALSARFTPEVLERFAKPLVYKTGKPNFLGPEVNGVVDTADRQNLIAAFDNAMANGGDMVLFATELHRLEDGDPKTLAPFVGQTIATFQSYYDKLHAITRPDKDQVFDEGTEIGRAFLDARQGEDFPIEWLSFRTYGHLDHLRYVRILAAQAAYGDQRKDLLANMQAAEQELQRLHDEYDKAMKLIDAGDKEGGRTLLNEGGKRRSRENAKKNLIDLALIRQAHNALHNVLSGAPQDEKTMTQTVGMAVAATVQGVTTAVTDTVTFNEAPFRKFGLGGPALRFVAGTWKNFFLDALGTLFQAIGLQLHTSLTHRRRLRVINAMGLSDIDALSRNRGFKSLVERYKEELGDEMTLASVMSRLRERPIAGIPDAAGAVVRRMNKAVKVALDTGIGRAKNPEEAYATLKLHAPFSQGVIWGHRAVAMSWLETVDEAVAKAVAYLRDHPKDAKDPAFRFDLKKFNYTGQSFLGMKWNERAFEYLNERLQIHGIHLEEAARRQLRGEEPLTTDQIRSVISLASEEMLLNSGTTTRPTWSMDSSLGRISTPLVGWSMSKMVDVIKSTRDPKFKASAKAFSGAMLTLVLAVAPASLIYAFMRDEYEEEILGKKQNVLPAWPPSVMGLLDNLARVGTFGIAGDVANSIFNVSTAREFSVDSRVFFISSLTSIAKTIGALWNQDGTATYQTVWRPFLMSIGGAGYLQNFDAINFTLDMDNAERRVVRRINVANQLRVSGRALGLDVRVSRGIQAMPNPVKPHVGNMVLAAMANDSSGFREAYQKALEAAAKEYRDDPGVDPYEKVATAFSSMHPLRVVFRASPSKHDYQRLLSELGEDGEEVAEAIRYFNAYASQVPRGRGKSGITPYYGVESRTPTLTGSFGSRGVSANFSIPSLQSLDFRGVAAGL